MSEQSAKLNFQGVKYVSMNEASGYGIAAKRYIKALAAADVNLTWSPMMPGQAWKLGYQPFYGRSAGDLELDLYWVVLQK